MRKIPPHSANTARRMTAVKICSKSVRLTPDQIAIGEIRGMVGTDFARCPVRVSRVILTDEQLLPVFHHWRTFSGGLKLPTGATTAGFPAIQGEPWEP